MAPEVAALPGPGEAGRGGHPIVTTRRELVHASSLKTNSPSCSWKGMEDVSGLWQVSNVSSGDHADNTENGCRDVVCSCQKGPHH